MSTAKCLKESHYRWWTRDGKCCGNCKHMMHTIVNGRHPHWCYIHHVSEFPHLRFARVAPWMVCDKYGKPQHNGGK